MRQKRNAFSASGILILIIIIVLCLFLFYSSRPQYSRQSAGETAPPDAAPPTSPVEPAMPPETNPPSEPPKNGGAKEREPMANGHSNEREPTANGHNSPIPAFPWPPPKASSQYVVPPEMIAYPADAPLKLRDIDIRLRAAMDQCDYTNKSYYSVPGGFAVVTQLEQINSDGTSKEDPAQRWSLKTGPLRQFSLSEYLKLLFFANPGYYRLVVFITTTQPFSQSETTLTPEEAQKLLHEGLDVLPDEIGSRPYTEQYKTTALVYEFERPETNQAAELKIPGRLTARIHLEKSNLWDSLEQQK